MIGLFNRVFGNKPTTDIDDIFQSSLSGLNLIHAVFVRDAERWRSAFLLTVPALVIFGLLTNLLLFSLLRNAVQTGGNHLYTVPVNDKGVVAGPVQEMQTTGTLQPTQAEVESKLTTFIESAFSASVDNKVNHDRLDDAYSLTGTSGTSWLDAYYANNKGANSPFIIGSKGINRSAVVQSIAVLSNTTYTATWTATDISVTDGTLQQTPMTCSRTFTTGIKTGKRLARDIMRNPFGITVIDVQPVVGIKSDDRCGFVQ